MHIEFDKPSCNCSDSKEPRVGVGVNSNLTVLLDHGPLRSYPSIDVAGRIDLVPIPRVSDFYCQRALRQVPREAAHAALTGLQPTGSAMSAKVPDCMPSGEVSGVLASNSIRVLSSIEAW